MTSIISSMRRFCLFLVLFSSLSGSFMGCSEAAEKDIMVKPQKGEFEVLVTTTGELQAQNSIRIVGPGNARKAGLYQMKITSLVAEGTIVSEGDVVAELDKSDLLGKIKEVEINLQKYQSQYTQARLDCTLTLSQARDDMINLQYAMEQKKLEKDESIYEAPSTQRQAEIEYEKADRAFEQAERNYRTKVQQATAKMREAEADLFKEEKKRDDFQEIYSDLTIKAPSKGMVIYHREWNGKKRGVGSSVSMWEPTVATLPDLSKMESITYVNEVDIQKLQSGQQVRISLDASPDKALTGTVVQVANIGEQRPNSDSKVFEVLIEVNEKDSTLRPAMTTSNQIVITSAPEALYVPLESVHTEDSLTFIYKKESGSIVKQEIELGLVNDNYAIVKQGLAESDEFLLSVPDQPEELKVNSLSSKAVEKDVAKAGL